MKRPSLARLWPHRRSEGDPSASLAASGRAQTENDTQILRGTRLRLMAVSGGITLVLLVLLGTAIYAVTANALAANSTTRLIDYANELAQGPSPQDSSPYEMAFGGERAGIVPVVVRVSDMHVFSLRAGLLPPGLPYQPGVKVAMAGGTDLRTATLTATNIQTGTATGTSTGTSTSSVPVRIYSEPIYDTTGAVAFVVQTCADRTEEAQLLGTLLWVLLVGGGAALLASLLAGYLYAGRALVPIRQSIDRRQAALQRQREFAANASHELRTPLTVIAASVEDLRRNRRSRVEDVGEALGDIDAEVRQMSALVEDMLLLARTDSGVLQIDRVNLDLGDVAADSASALSALGQERGVKVVLDPLPTPLNGDPLRLRQLVTILVDNAIRHSRSASIVSVYVRPEPGFAVLRVDDEGTGIKPENLPHVFERFWRADDAPAGGTGLGLAIARWIVDQHGGTIAAANRPEGGASFLVRLPLVGTVVEPRDPGVVAAPGAPAGSGGEPAPEPAPDVTSDEPPRWPST